MASTISDSLLSPGGVTFSLRDGTKGIIAPDDRRMYDHIIRVKIGNFPSEGLTGQSLMLITGISVNMQPNPFIDMHGFTQTLKQNLYFQHPVSTMTNSKISGSVRRPSTRRAYRMVAGHDSKFMLLYISSKSPNGSPPKIWRFNSPAPLPPRPQN